MIQRPPPISDKLATALFFLVYGFAFGVAFGALVF